MGASASIQKNISYDVFLGGSCNPTKWRKDEAIPKLQDAGVKFFNPQVDDWSPDCEQKEEDAKENSKILLFVIDSLTRSVVSMEEATYYIGQGRKVVLVVNDVTKTFYPNEHESKDLNRGRFYLRKMAERNETPIFADVASAIEYIVKMLKN